VDVDQERNVYTQELRLASVGDGDVSWLLGAFAQFRHDPEQTLFHVIPIDLAIPTSNRAKYRQYSLFGNASYSVGRWILEGGARVEYDENSLRDVGAGVEITQDGTEVLPRVSATYRFSDDIRGYASVTRGFTPGAVVNERRVVAYDAEKTLNYELGLKGAGWNDRLRYETAVFYIDYSDRLFQINQVVPFVGLVATTTNIGSSRNYGFELSTTARLTRDLTFSVALGMTEAEWEDAVILEPNTGNPNFDLNGMTAPFTPEYQATVTLDWARPLSASALIGLRVDAAFIGDQWWDLGNFTRQRAYELVNIGARVELGKWDLSANLTNATDSGFHTAYYTGPEVGAPFDIAGLGQPRTWIVKLTGRF
jgi:iron complex outermembrane receptor protein